MTAQSSSYSSLPSRLLFIVTGAATGLVMSVAGIGGLWAIPGAIVGLVVFGELYLFFTERRSREQ